MTERPSAAEAERAAKPLTMNQMADALVGSLVAAGECDPEPAPEVVDVPQPLVIRKRLAGSEHSAAWSSDEPDVVTLYIGGAGEDAPLALLRAMLAAIDAQDRMVAIKGHHARWDAQLAPTRPEPRYKVGDWVRVVTGPNSAGRTTPIRVTCVTSAGYIMADGASWAAENLTPALDPALHETARTAARMLLCGDSRRAVFANGPKCALPTPPLARRPS